MSPEIQGMYAQVLQQYELMMQQKVQAESALNSQFIPTGGAMVRADLWVPDPMSETGKQQRASFPYEALSWLKDRLDKQGMTQEAIANQRQSVISDMAGMMRNVTPVGDTPIQPNPDDLKGRISAAIQPK